MKYYVELSDEYEEYLEGKLYPVDPRTDRFGDEEGEPQSPVIVEDETGYSVTL